MKSAYVITLGFDERFAIKTLLKHHVSESDKILLIVAGSDPRTAKAIETLSNILRQFSEKIEITKIELHPERDFEGSLMRMIKILKKLQNLNIVVNISGGMRILGYIVLLACTILVTHGVLSKVSFEIYPESLQGEVTFSGDLLRLAAIKLTKEKVRLLKEIASGKTYVEELAKALDKDETTIRRHLLGLEAQGLIRALKRKPLKVEITRLGRLLLEIYS